MMMMMMMMMIIVIIIIKISSNKNGTYKPKNAKASIDEYQKHDLMRCLFPVIFSQQNLGGATASLKDDELVQRTATHVKRWRNVLGRLWRDGCHEVEDRYNPKPQPTGVEGPGCLGDLLGMKSYPV